MTSALHFDVAVGNIETMPRWEPHVEERLRLAALDLYTTKGYESTTVGDVATRAGVTSRTYFRYFPDKREVLFGGADALRDRVACSLRDAPAEMPPLTATLHAMSTCEDLFHLHGHEQLRRRDAVISTSSELQEREAHKLASIAAVVASGLVERGSAPDSAQLVADLALAAFKQASWHWMDDPATPFAVLLYRAAAQAREVLIAQARSEATQQQ